MTNESGFEHTLKPIKAGVKPFRQREVYPETKPDEYGIVKGGDKDRSALSGVNPNQSEVAHYRSDVDSSKIALHHTLGTGRNQAAPGNHIHDGVSSPKLGPLEMDPATPGQTRPELTCAATADSIRTLLHEFINFRDV